VKAIRFSAMMVVIFALLVAVSCTKRQSTNAAEPEIQAAINQSGIVAWQGAPFYVDSGTSDQPRVEWKSALDFGTKVRETKGGSRQTFAVGGQNLTLVAVEVTTADGTSVGWIQPAHFAGDGAEAAVVKDTETALLESPASNAKVLTRLHRLDLVAVVRTTASGDLIRAMAFDPVRKTLYPEASIDGGTLSFDRDDVAAAVLVAKAAASRNADQAKSILENAAQSFPSSAFIGDIRKLLGGDGSQAQGPSVEPISAVFTVRTDGAVIHSSPSKDSDSVATLKIDDDVTTASRTVDSFDVDGQKAHWYEVITPAQGWVFGSNLEGAD